MAEQINYEEKAELIKDMFVELPIIIQKRLSSKLSRIANNKPVYMVDTGDTVYTAYTISGVQRIFENLVGKKPDRSNIYKALRANKRKIYGAIIKKIYEGDEDYGTID